MLELVAVRHRYDGRVVLDIERFAVAPGSGVAIVGPNGSGKSTLLRLLALLERPSEGEVRLDGVAVAGAGPRRRITLVEQRPVLLRGTVRENLAFGLQVRGIRRTEVSRKVENVAARLGITPLLHRRRHELSDGEVQRVAVARALAGEPDVLLLDEPASSAARLLGAQRVHGARDPTLASAAGDRPSDGGRRCGTRSGRHGGGGAGSGAHAGRPSGVFLQGQCGAGVLAVPISYLTRIVEFSATREAVAVYVWERIAPRLPRGVTLHAVRVQEGPHIYSEYFGEP